MIEIVASLNIICDNPNCKDFITYHGLVPYGLDPYELSKWVIQEKRVWWITKNSIKKVFCNGYCEEEYIDTILEEKKNGD